MVTQSSFSIKPWTWTYQTYQRFATITNVFEFEFSASIPIYERFKSEEISRCIRPLCGRKLKNYNGDWWFFRQIPTLIGQKHLSLKAVEIIKIVIFSLLTFPVSWIKLDFFFQVACMYSKKYIYGKHEATWRKHLRRLHSKKNLALLT
jgi:hypothetical protein